MLAALACTTTARAQSICASDINSDGLVDGGDLALVISSWGPCGACDADLNEDGVVDGNDLAPILVLWGRSCEPLPWATVLEWAPNPGVVVSAELRAAISTTRLPWRVRDNLTQIEMVLIPPGSFNMGCSASGLSACGSEEHPVHSVTLTSAFYMGRCEVTQAQWTAQMGSNPSTHQSASAQVPAAQVPNRPVENLMISAMQSFVAATGLRLPTEAEWEYACRAGTPTAFHGWPALPAGTDVDAQIVNIGWTTADAGMQTRPVGGKAPNGFGLFDMLGNVWEVTADWYSSTYYASSPWVNPTGPASAIYRAGRGGSFATASGRARSSVRSWTSLSKVHPDRGFRVARNP